MRRRADASCAVADRHTRLIDAATSAGGSPPWYYVMVGATARLLSNGRRLLAYRMVAVMLCAGILGYAVSRAHRYAGAAWLLVALTPSAWFLIGVVGTSGIEIALVALALVEAVGRYRGGAAASLLRVAVPLGVCLLLRPAAFVDLAVVALVVAPTVPRPIRRRDVAMLASPLAVAGVATLAWGRWADLVVSDSRTADSDTLITAVRRSVEGIPLTAHQTVGALGWNEFYAPPAAQLVWILGLAFAVYWVATRSTDRWWHARWVVAAVLLPTLVEVIGHRRIGEIWQGRYSIPFAMGAVLIAAAWTAPRRIGDASDRDRRLGGGGAHPVAHPPPVHGRPRRLAHPASCRVAATVEPVVAARRQRRRHHRARRGRARHAANPQSGAILAARGLISRPTDLVGSDLCRRWRDSAPDGSQPTM